MIASAYPAACDALLTIFNTAYPSTGPVYVSDGPGDSDTGQLQFVFVGVEVTDELSLPGKGGTGGGLWATMGTNHSRDERFGVNCQVRYETGDQDPKACRDGAVALLGTALAAVVADPSIGRPGGVLYVENYTWDYYPFGDENGTAGVIDFVLNFRARI